MAEERGEEKQTKMIDAARMYYQLDYSQQEIAQHLGVSRPTVSRFLQQAKHEGIVQITIVDPREHNVLYEEQLGISLDYIRLSCCCSPI